MRNSYWAKAGHWAPWGPVLEVSGGTCCDAVFGGFGGADFPSGRAHFLDHFGIRI